LSCLALLLLLHPVFLFCPVLSGGELLDYGMDPPLDVVLEEALRRLGSSETWKIWSFGAQEFYDSESFRNHIQQQHIR
jgi:hypothetical protein